MLLMIGNQFGEHKDQICGAVVSRRKKGDKINLWTREGSKKEAVTAIGCVRRCLRGGTVSLRGSGLRRASVGRSC